MGFPAGAESGWVGCTGDVALTLNPGLNQTPRDIALLGTGSFGSCTSSDPSITSATLSVVGQGYGLTCLDSAPFTGTGRFTWDNGNYSDTVFVTEGVPGAGYVEAAVVDGQFRGASVRIVALFDADRSRCSTEEGITSVSARELVAFH